MSKPDPYYVMLKQAKRSKHLNNQASSRKISNRKKNKAARAARKRNR